MKFAAIDIGSNAIRLLFVNVVEHLGKTHFHKISLTRSPVRLGADTFLKGRISDERKEDLIKTLTAYRNLIEVHKVTDYLCYATSAMRDAENGVEIAEEAFQKSGVKVNIITGEEEAGAIYAIHVSEDLDADGTYLYIDVGGGSTELTCLHKGVKIASASFKIGTIRLLEQIVPSTEWLKMGKWIEENVLSYDNVQGVGTGGNINKIFKFTDLKEGKPVTYQKLEKCREHLSSFSFQERISVLGLREDRADVILPASEIYLFVMKYGHIKKIFVPKLGLADGMVHLMYEKAKLNKKKVKLG